MTLKQSEPSWNEAKRQLGDPDFLNQVNFFFQLMTMFAMVNKHFNLFQLRDFDKDNIPDKVLKKIAVFTRNPEFEPTKVGAQSMAAKSLAMWVIAIEKYAKIFK